MLSLYVEGHEKNPSLNFMSLVSFQASKIWGFCRKFTAEQVLKSSGRNNAIESLAFGFSNSLPYGLEESKELRTLIS